MSYIPPRVDSQMFGPAQQPKELSYAATSFHYREAQQQQRDARKRRIAEDNKLNYEMLAACWTGDAPCVHNHLFKSENRGEPRYTLIIEVWKPLINAYFAWYSIPRENCTRVWMAIVDHILHIPRDYPAPDVEFREWAFGCLCMFLLEDEHRKGHMIDVYQVAAPMIASGSNNSTWGAMSEPYDPERPSIVPAAPAPAPIHIERRYDPYCTKSAIRRN